MDVVDGISVRDFVWSKTDGWKAPAVLAVPAGPAPGVGPGLAHRGGGIFDLVVRGSDQYYHAFLAPGAGWSAWEPIGGWGGDPAVTTTLLAGSAVVDVWVHSRGSIWHRRWKWPSWRAWEEIARPRGKAFVTSPGVVVRPGGTIDIVAATAGDGQLYHAFFSPEEQFSGWQPIPGRTFSRPALTSPAATRLDLWVRGASDGLAYHSVWDPRSGWSGFETSINTAPGTPRPSLATGLAAVLAEGVTTIAAVDSNNRLLVRSWADSVPAGATAQPTARITNTLITNSAENSVVVVPPSAGATQTECRDGGVIYSRGASWDLERVSYACVVSGVGLQRLGPMGVCPATQVATIPNTGSNDSQIVRLNDGKLVWLFQSGGVSSPAVRGCKGLNVTRGTESVRVSADCGKTWNLVAVLDPCVGAPFTVSATCNTNAVPDNSCRRGATSSPPTGTDRPELLASTFDDSIYMAVGVAGTAAYNLHILKSRGASLEKWQDLDTGLPSGGAVAMVETATHVYLARAEYGNPANAGLYRIAKGAALVSSNFAFMGNLADRDATDNVQLSVLTDASGDLIFRWAYLTGTGGLRRGFSKLSPGGVLTLASDLYQPPSPAKAALPTLVASPKTSDRAFLYWYEGTSDATGTYSVKGAMSDGLARWSAPITLGGPWPGSATFTRMGKPGNDYLKGVYLVGEDMFLATWLQPELGCGAPEPAWAGGDKVVTTMSAGIPCDSARAHPLGAAADADRITTHSCDRTTPGRHDMASPVDDAANPFKRLPCQTRQDDATPQAERCWSTPCQLRSDRIPVVVPFTDQLSTNAYPARQLRRGSRPAVAGRSRRRFRAEPDDPQALLHRRRCPGRADRGSVGRRDRPQGAGGRRLGSKSVAERRTVRKCWPPICARCAGIPPPPPTGISCRRPSAPASGSTPISCCRCARRCGCRASIC